jgi:lysophospholipase L1-like esterase
MTAPGSLHGALSVERASATPSRTRLGSGARELLLNAALVLMGIVFAALTAEVFTRVFAPQRLYRYPRGLYAAHATRAYRFAPNFRGRLTTPEYSTAMVINSLGLRDDREYGRKPSGTFRILVLGDSFTAGIGVEGQEAFPKRVEEELTAGTSGLRFEAINAGVPSYSTREEVLYLEQEGFQLQPDLVLLALFIGNDVVDNTRTTWSRVVDGELVDGAPRRGVLPLAVRGLLSRHSHLYHLLWPYQRWLLGHGAEDRLAAERALAIYEPPDAAGIEPAWQATERWLERLGQVTRARQVQLGVILIPELLQLDPAAWHAAASRLNPDAEAYQPERPNQHLAGILQRLGIPSLDLLGQLRAALPGRRLYFQRDGHWTPEGHRVVASAIVTFLQRQRLVPGLHERGF